MDDDSSPPSLADSFERALAQPIEAVAPLLPGTVVGERYEVIETLGAGGMGRVYLANDRDLKRKVALKHQRQRGGRDEALAMARLAHPNVVAVFEVGEHAGATFVAMEYVAGKTLRAWLAQGRSREAIVEALLAAGEGLVAAHEA